MTVSLQTESAAEEGNQDNVWLRKNRRTSIKPTDSTAPSHPRWRASVLYHDDRWGFSLTCGRSDSWKWWSEVWGKLSVVLRKRRVKFDVPTWSTISSAMGKARFEHQFERALRSELEAGKKNEIDFERFWKYLLIWIMIYKTLLNVCGVRGELLQIVKKIRFNYFTNKLSQTRVTRTRYVFWQQINSAKIIIGYVRVRLAKIRKK